MLTCRMVGNMHFWALKVHISHHRASDVTLCHFDERDLVWIDRINSWSGLVN